MKQQSPTHKKNRKTALNNKPYFMALLSGTAYKEPEFSKKVFTKHGFTKSKFIDIDGAQCYIIWDNEDTIIAFRGTEPKEMSDVKADLNALKKYGFNQFSHLIRSILLGCSLIYLLNSIARVLAS